MITNNKTTLLFILLFVLGVIVRLGFYLSSGSEVFFLRGDAAKYMLLGINLIEHNSYSMDNSAFTQAGTGAYLSSSLITPGYPLLVSAVYFFARETATTITVLAYIQILLSSLTPALLFLISMRILPRVVALFPCLVFSLYPHQITNSFHIITEPLFGFQLTLFVYLFLISIEKRSTVLTVLSGCIIGYATLTRPVLLPFTPFLLLASTSLDSVIRKKIIIVIICTVVFWLPWAMWGKYSADIKASNLRTVVTLGSYPDHTYKELRGFPNDEDPDFDMSASSWGNLSESILKKFKDNPAEMTRWYFLGKPQTIWQFHLVQSRNDGTSIYSSNSPVYKNPGLYRATLRIAEIIHYPVFMLSVFVSLISLLLHFFRIWRIENTAIFVSVSLVTYVTLFHIPLAALSRFSIPFQGFAILVAAAFIFHCFKRLSSYQNRV